MKRIYLSDNELALLKSFIRPMVIDGTNWPDKFARTDAGQDAAARLYYRLFKPIEIKKPVGTRKPVEISP